VFNESGGNSDPEKPVKPANFNAVELANYVLEAYEELGGMNFSTV